MSQNKVEFLIEGDGKIFRRDIVSREIRITNEITTALCKDVSITVKNLMATEKQGMISMRSEMGGSIWWTVMLNHLNLRCPFIMRDGFFVPQLDRDDEPIITLPWEVPNSMRLVFLAETAFIGSRSRKQGYCYLFAIDENGDYYRLPLGNLYDECRICMGQEEFLSFDHLTTLNMVLEQFSNSEWNADLWTTERATQSMFRFVPDGTGFKQAVMAITPWTKLCAKIGHATTEKVVL